MSLRGTTPVPNIFLDDRMANLSSSSVRVYLKIVRNTLGWRDRSGGYKRRDWIAHSQYEQAGVSSRSVTKAVEELLSAGLIRVTNEQGQSLKDPKQRKLTHRIYYAPILESNEIDTFNIAHNDNTNAINDPGPKKFLPSTKDIHKRKYNADERIPDHERLKEILMDEQLKQRHRDNWSS